MSQKTRHVVTDGTRLAKAPALADAAHPTVIGKEATAPLDKKLRHACLSYYAFFLIQPPPTIWTHVYGI